MANPIRRSNIFINIKFLWRNWIGFFLLILLLGLTHSSLFQCNWNLQSLQLWLEVYSFFNSSSFSCAFLLIFCPLSGGSPLVIFPYTTHQKFLSMVYWPFTLTKWFWFYCWCFLEHLFHIYVIHFISNIIIVVKYLNTNTKTI